MFGLKFSSKYKLFGGCHPCSRATSATLAIAILIENTTITITWICPIKSAVGFKIVARSPSEGFVASEEIRRNSL